LSLELRDGDAAGLQYRFDDGIGQREALAQCQCIGLELDASADVLKIAEVERPVAPIGDLGEVANNKTIDAAGERECKDPWQRYAVGLQIKVHLAGAFRAG